LKVFTQIRAEICAVKTLKLNFRPILWKPVSHQNKHVKLKIKYWPIYYDRTKTSLQKKNTNWKYGEANNKYYTIQQM